MVVAAVEARQNHALLAHVESIYRYADAAIAARQPVCYQSGRCCQFEKMKHSLFVSTVELAYFLHTARLERNEEPIGGACPFVRLGPGRCAARQGRPLGCRMFYCDPRTQWWQQDLYNQLHGRLQRLHEQFHVPYYYAEWLAILRSATEQIAR